MTIANIIHLLGGLGFFLFGMSLLGDGLKRVAGGKLETVLSKLTSTTFKGVLLGAFVTAVIQSSSATTVMAVGFVNSGIMKLANAIGIIMGANIGTTATGWVLVLAGMDGGGISSATIFAFVAFIGIVLYFFCKKQTQKNIGMIMLAFSVLMSGMQSMSSAMEQNDSELAKMVEPLEETIDNLTKTCKTNHIHRVQAGNCTLELGFIFNDCLHNIERVADHCSNLAVAVLESNRTAVHSHDYLRSIKEEANNQYQILLAGYTAKYKID